MKREKKIDQSNADPKKKKNEQEQREILSKIGQGGGKQLDISESGIKSIKEIKVFALGGGTDDPKKKYDYYYNGLQRLLKKYLPKGERNKAGRQLIYEEKSTFLTRGHRKNKKGIRGADSRMTYISDAKIALDLVSNWVLRKGTPIELFDDFRNLNIKKGYGIADD